MDDPGNTGALLFSYGTLRDEVVQRANFGRKLVGRPDVLPGYTLGSVMVHDSAVVSLSGKSEHTIAIRSTNPTDEVPGVVFEITALELEAADRYEVADYTRVLATLKSGAQAWVYVDAQA